MKKTSKILTLLLVAVLGLSLLSGCKSKGSDGESSGSDTLGESSLGAGGDLEEIIVAATIEPHATILNSDAFKEALAAEGYKVKVVEYTDYVQPNVAVDNGSADANFFQHIPYLDDYNAENGTELTAAAEVHFEPIGIYSNTITSIKDIKEGDKVAIPNDTTNEARALLLLEKAGLITLKEGAGLAATVLDIDTNELNLEFVEVEAAQTPNVLPDVTIAVINGNYALQAGLSTNTDALLAETVDSEAAAEYKNVLVVNADNENSEKTLALVKAISSDAVREFIEETWKGAVVPVF